MLPQACLPLALGQEDPPGTSASARQPAWEGRGAGSTLGPPGPQGSCCCCCCPPAHKDTLQEALVSPFPQLSGLFFAFLLPAPQKLWHFAPLSWQEMDSGTEQDLEKSGSAAMDGDASQLPQAGPEEAAECSQCPICLGDIEDAAYVAFCLHRFCFACIKEWARRRARCPLCREPFNLVLHSVQADDHYEEYVVPSSSLRLREVIRERVRSRSPQRHGNPHSWATDDVPSASRRQPVGSPRAQRQGAAPGPSSQQAPTPSTARERAPQRAGECPVGPAAAAYERISRAVQQARLLAHCCIQ